MSKVRVYEVAKQLNMDQKSLVALFQSIGVGDVRNHMSAVESDQVERLKRHLERQKTPESLQVVWLWKSTNGCHLGLIGRHAMLADVVP
jgi:hypothetical protein